MPRIALPASHPRRRTRVHALQATGLAAAFAGLLSAQHLAHAQGLIGSLTGPLLGTGTSVSALAQTPLFVSQSAAPLNMLVMGRDHKLYYEAYNDASDLNGGGTIDIGYKPALDYYGYFNNKACYEYGGTGTSGLFTPVAPGTGVGGKACPGGKRWSGDFLNYLTTSRMDALRRVLYGGTRAVDTATSTVLQATAIPSDAHSWGKAYDPMRDPYDISDYAPLQRPAAYTRHLFAMTTLDSHAQPRVPQLRVLNDTTKQVWDWVSKEGVAAQDQCMGYVDCVQPTGPRFTVLPATAYRNLSITTWKRTGDIPNNQNQLASHFAANAVPANLCGSGRINAIDVTGAGNNPFAGNNDCGQDHYITQFEGQVYIPGPGTYSFAVDGDDAVQATLNGITWGWYGGHNYDRSEAGLQSHSALISFAGSGWANLRFRHVEGTGGESWGLAMKIQQPANGFANYNVRVQACGSSNAALREDSCKLYPNSGGTAIYKPTGLLHDFGEGDRMHFGLLTGSYQKNIEGGTLRRNIGSFKTEVNPQTGVFDPTVQGLVKNIDRLRSIYTNCGWVVDGPISQKPDPSICAMWGNPVGEMMFETLRYFAGAGGAHSRYDYGNGNSIDRNLGLAKPDWVAPYEPTTNKGAGYPYCARPVATVLSDINPSYDFKLPGSRYDSAFAPEAAALGALNIADQVRAIGTDEQIAGKHFFIGQSTAANGDSAPTVKKIDDLSLARGLAPQEPGKEGTYSAAGVARFASQNKVLGNTTGKIGMSTYSVALASPLPELRFPVGNGRYVTIAPFSKTVTGSFVGNTVDNTKYTPTNQIVDYYLDRIENIGAVTDATLNGGRPYAEFRINYEDVEQGADHDMDAIARYTIAVQADSTVKIDMLSEYALGSYGLHMGYVISGTTQDGLYLEIRDKDTNAVYYGLNTPPNRAPGYCANRPGEAECANLGLAASRSFTPSDTPAASFLEDPLWYAAKYGIPGRDGKTVQGNPDNYFLVTNATTLKAQMTKAFNDILQRNNSVTQAAVDLPGGTLEDGGNVYRTHFDVQGWTGDVLRDRTVEVKNTATDGTVSYTRSTTPVWSAAQKLAARTTPRNILYAGAGAATPVLRPFTFAGIQGQTADKPWLDALNRNPANDQADGQAQARIGFLRGENDGFRSRTRPGGTANRLGDIVNSSLVHVRGALYRAGAADVLEGAGSNYAAFAASQAAQGDMLYVGANDGMLHALRASDGVEQFAYIPSAVRGHLNVLTSPDYGANGGTPHRYFVDGTPVVSDVYFGNAWHKVLVGSLGAGGRQMFALDITDPTRPRLLWEFGEAQNDRMGYSMAPPTIARLNDNGATKGKWVALVPSGYEGEGSKLGNASLFVLDIATGNVLKRLDMLGSGVLSAAELAALPLGNGLSRATAVDGNRDGRIDRIYAGDLAGNMWRINTNDGNLDEWRVERLYMAKDARGARQPITSAPYVLPHPSGRGDLVTFGTGRLLTESDKNNTQTQTIYAIWDRAGSYGPDSVFSLLPPTRNMDRANLQPQSFTELAAGSGNFGLSSRTVQWYKANARGTADRDVQKWGWYVDLPRAGEQMTYDMQLYGRGLFITSMRRTSDDPCEAGVESTLYGIDPNSGGQTDYVVFDTNNDGVFNALDAVNGTLVSGIPAGAAGRQSLAGGQAVDSSGTSQRINAGVEFGRQSWRRQPPNPKQ